MNRSDRDNEVEADNDRVFQAPNDRSERKRGKRCESHLYLLFYLFNQLLTTCVHTFSGFNNVPKTTNVGGYVEDTPKGASRILNSLQTQAAYNERKKAGEAGPSKRPNSKPNAKGPTSNDKGKGKAPGLPKILPGESLGEYNRRLEDHLRPEVSGVIKAAAAAKAQAEKAIWQEKKANREAAKEARRRKERGEPAVPVEKKTADGKGKRKATIMDDTDDDDDDTANSSKSSSAKKPRKTEFETLDQRRRVNDVVQAPPQLPGLKRGGLKKPATIAFSATGRTPLNPGQKRLMEEERDRVIQRYREMKEAKLQQRQAEK